MSDTPPSVPTACVNPIDSTTANGVQLVLGGTSQIDFQKGSAGEFCATYSATSIPTALYGLKADVGSGVNTVHAQSGCVITVGGCVAIRDDGNGTKPSFYFQGFVYTPWASIDMAINNTSQPYFNFGIIARTLGISTTGSACTPPACAPFISLPDNSPGFGTAATIVDLTVYVCEAQSACASGGKVALTARVKVDDPSGSPVAGQRNITVLSWSEQR
jgi:hypothetical protein